MDLGLPQSHSSGSPLHGDRAQPVRQVLGHCDLLMDSAQEAQPLQAPLDRGGACVPIVDPVPR